MAHYFPKQVVWARISPTSPAWSNGPRLRGKRRQGKIYEHKVHGYLERRAGDRFLPEPWLQYMEYSDGPVRYCQPDGIICDVQAGTITPVEVKLKHTEGSFWQLRELYLPVLQAVFGPDWSYPLLTVVRWYDPFIPYPVEPALAPDPLALSEGGVNVHIWDGKRP